MELERLGVLGVENGVVGFCGIGDEVVDVEVVDEAGEFGLCELARLQLSQSAWCHLRMCILLTWGWF